MSAYSHETRVLTCASCGAPLEAAISGGEVRCGYCSAVNQVLRRDESADLERARQDTGVSEGERFARLREQDRQAPALPESLLPLVVDGSLPEERVPEARQQWLAARGQLAATPSFPVAERLFHLTVMIEPWLTKEMERRALLETAVELLPDEGHRHILRSLLARQAARVGDVSAAEQWLAPCNPRPLDLSMDTAYRLASSVLAVARNEPRKVVEQLGMAAGDVPIDNREELLALALRLDAADKVGSGAAADTELEAWLRAEGSSGAERFRGVLQRLEPLSIAQGPFARVERKLLQEELTSLTTAHESASRPYLAVNRGKLLTRLVVSFGIWLAVLMVIGFTWHEQDLRDDDGRSNTFFGVVPALVCPDVCPGCRGPFAFGWGKTWCTDPEGKLDAYATNKDLDQLGGEFIEVPPWVHPLLVSKAEARVALWLVVLLSPFALLLAFLLTWRRARAGQLETAAEQARLSAELQRVRGQLGQT